MIEKIGGKTFEGGTLTIVTKDDAELKLYRNGVLFADNLSGGTSGLFDLEAIAKNVKGNVNYKTYFLLSTLAYPLSERQQCISRVKWRIICVVFQLMGGLHQLEVIIQGLFLHPQ